MNKIKNLCLASSLVFLLNGCGLESKTVYTNNIIVVKRNQNFKLVQLYNSNYTKCTNGECNLWVNKGYDINNNMIANVCPIGHITNDYEIVGALSEIVDVTDSISKVEFTEINEKLSEYVQVYEEHKKPMRLK